MEDNRFYRELEAKRTERGWAGHFICASRCKFRLNTLIEYKDIKIVVSTVGNMWTDDEDKNPKEIGYNRHYETMAFFGVKIEGFIEANVERQINFDSEWCISEPFKDNEANEMHENVVQELMRKIKDPELLNKTED